MTIDTEKRDRIKNGIVAGGSNIKMAAEHGVSRGTIQNARLELESEQRLRSHMGGLLPGERAELEKLRSERKEALRRGDLPDEKYGEGQEPTICFRCGVGRFGPRCGECGFEFRL